MPLDGLTRSGRWASPARFQADSPMLSGRAWERVAQLSGAAQVLPSPSAFWIGGP